MSDIKKYLNNRAKRHKQIMKKFVKDYHQEMENILEKMLFTYRNNGKFIIMGNGGSAGDSQHMSAEFLGRFKKDRPPIAAIALTTDTSTLTAISNDYSYDDVFSRQLQALVRSSDLVFAISTSGNSKNVCKAVENCPVFTVSLTGKTGGKLKDLTDFNLNVELAEDSAEAQEMHIFIIHSLIDIFEGKIKDELHNTK
jgi:D-sedoheptulose 7-phosphate isomerase